MRSKEIVMLEGSSQEKIENMYSFEYTEIPNVLHYITGVGVSRSTKGIANTTMVSKVIVIM
jgi:hypothetical protein